MPAFLLVPALIGAVEPVQPVLLPQAELVRRLDPAQEWLFLPLAEWRKLTAAAVPPDLAARPGAGLVSGSVTVACDAQGCSAVAELVAIIPAGAPGTAPLFANPPERLESLTVAGSPGLVVEGGAPLALLLPGGGRWAVAARWGQRAPADADAGWTADLPLPLAGALDVVVTAPAGWEVHGEGLVADGDGRWRLAAAGSRLVLALRPAGSRAQAWGATQRFAVSLPAAIAGGIFTWDLDQADGDVPEQIRLRLPPGFTATAGGTPQADGSLLVPRGATVSGIVAAGAAIDLPALAGARWQGGIIDVDIDAPASLATPAGWLPLAPGRKAEGSRRFAVAHPGAPLLPQPLAAADGIDLRAAAAIAVGGGTVRATWALTVRAGVPLHRIDTVMPAGWRVIALDAGTGPLDLPPADEIQAAPWPLAIDLPKALATGTARTIAVTLERPADATLAVQPPLINGTLRSSHRVLIAADPASEVALAPGSWRLGPPAGAGAGLEAVAELVATDAVPPLTLTIRPRPARLEAEAACWLLPRGEDTLARLDLRLAVAGGAIDAIAIELPAALGDGWQIEAGDATLADGRLAWPKPWSGERLVRLSARLAAGDGRTAAIRPRLRLGDAPAPLRLAVAALAGDRVDVVASPAGRTLEPDELPAWSAPPPGTRILAAWRPAGSGDAGAVTARVPRLHDGPAGFLDRVELRTQVGPGGGTTLLTARLAAPGLAALPLRLPAGTSLELAMVDGEIAPLRRDGDAVAVVLPGRTQVQLALRLLHPAAPGDFDLALPRIDLPWLDTRWTVAVAPAWRATPLGGPGAMPLQPIDPLPRRGFLGTWTPALPRHDGVLPPPPAVEAHADPRFLGGGGAVAPSARPAEHAPVLPLVGIRLGGARIGAPAGLRLHLAVVDDLAAADRLGRILGLAAAAALAALALAGRAPAWRLALVALGGALASAALLAAQFGAGPLLGACEMLALLTPGAALIAWMRRRMGGAR